MDWRSALTENWPYKLAAVVLAVLLWFNVSANQERIEQSVPTRLELDFRDSAWVPVKVPDEVETAFRGRGGDLLDLFFDRPAIHRTVEGVTDSVLRLQLDPAMVEYDRRLRVQPVAVRPPEVVVRLEPVLARRVPVTMGLVEASAAEGFTLLGDPIVQPESVTVRGPRSELRRVSHLETEPLSLEKLQATTTRQLPLRPPAGEGVTVRPSQVLVTLRVDSLVERRVSVVVEVAGKAGAGLALFPSRVTVVLRGAARVVHAITPGEVRATVEVAEPPAAPVRLPVEVRLPRGVAATAEPDPPLVLASPRATEGAGRATPEGRGG